MQTEHALRVGDAAEMSAVADESVELVVTSPPYPMIEMWDDLFASRDPSIGAALERGDAEAAFERMHAQLDAVWDEVVRALVPGGIVCVNVGDATRSVGGGFRQFPNHARIVDALTERGLRPLPDVLWRKPTNRLTKFMGSGMLPPSAYVTLEHEYVLIFRKGGTRAFPAGDRARYESAFFWEERNEWFSDLWELQGEGQSLSDSTDRERSGAFPLELPLRLIRMYSLYGDTVLDPFAGTGTTALAAMLAGRNSLGHELDADLIAAFDERLSDLPRRSRERIAARLDRHRTFVAGCEERPSYEAVHYDFPVVTKQERRIRLYAVESVSERATPTDDRGSRYVVEYVPVDGDSAADHGSPVDDGSAVDGTSPIDGDSPAGSGG
ncbi:DNA-methyltransferase [Halegenticoccus soli]|uniref:DNA-methyltransferase n=1 Tax=Halegenticoccus soli TaxID=1985678 RepID=UPI000C6E1A32|nr:site-specific DNA-methyltransferase [Halegenticoccus soli]